MDAFNRQRWGALCEDAGFAADAKEFFAELARRYGEPQRAYHNSEHISECLEELDRVREHAVEAVGLEFAIWFHDIVYDPRGSRNEEESARSAVQFLKSAGAHVELQEQVERLVMATKTHRSEGANDIALIVDIDLSILGRPDHRYARYEADIRKEYAWVAPEVYAAKRAEILREFLERPRIFSFEEMRAKYEGQARENLKKAIERLTAGGGAKPAPEG